MEDEECLQIIFLSDVCHCAVGGRKALQVLTSFGRFLTKDLSQKHLFTYFNFAKQSPGEDWGPKQIKHTNTVSLFIRDTRSDSFVIWHDYLQPSLEFTRTKLQFTLFLCGKCSLLSCGGNRSFNMEFTPSQSIFRSDSVSVCCCC